MSYNPHARYRYGGELYHGRTKGSRNGVSNTPGYIAKGKLAVGKRMPDGTYMYTDTGTGDATYGRQKNFQRMAAERDRNQRQGSAINARMGRIATNAAGGREAQQAKGSAMNATLRRDQKQKFDNSLQGKVHYAGKAVGKVASNAGNWLGERANEARSTIGRAASNAGNWLNARRNDLGNLWDGKAGKGTGLDQMREYGRSGRGKEAQAAKESYNRSIVGRINNARQNAGNWLRDRGIELGDTAKRAASAASRFAGDVARRAGEAWDGKAGKGTAKQQMQAYGRSGRGKEAQEAKERYDRSIVGRLDNARQNAGNWLRDRGVELESTAKKAAGTVGRAASDVARRAGEAWDGQAGRGTGKETARRLGKEGAGKASNESQRKYNRSVVGRAEALGRTVSSGAKQIGKATKNIGEYATARAQELRSTIGGLPSSVKRQAESIISDIKSGRTAAEIQAKEIELENLLRNNMGGQAKMPSDDYLDAIAPKKKKK